MGEGDGLGTLGEGRIHHALVFVVVGGAHFLERGKTVAVAYLDAFQVHGIVHGGFEFFRLQVQGVHLLLGFPHAKFRGRCLQHMLGIGRGETEHLVAIDHGFSQAVGQLYNAFLRFFVADGIEIHAARHAGQGGEEEALFLAAAHLLQDDGHLFFRDHVGRGGDIATRSGKIHAGIDALDGFGQQAQLLVFVFYRRNHVGGVNARKRLVIRIFQFGR